MELPDTLSQVITRLRQQGYNDDLNRHEDNPLWLDPDAYTIDHVYRFETVPLRRTGRCGTD